ncbi:MAG TPA: HlyD family secretion protein [Acetobacteraceae bacterium]|nr:HlyD family secretion protein [Acetobacteraceae bacterium]
MSDAPARNADGPFSRDIPQETKERPVPRAQVEYVAAEKREAPGKNRSRRPLMLSFAALLLASVAGGGYVYWDDSSHFESTDDAFIAARQFAIAPKVSGYIAAVPVTDNQHVQAGQVIARIDDSDYRTALAQAEAQVEAGQASIANIDAQIAVQQAQVAESLSQVQQQQASLTFAQQQASRYSNLAKDGWGTMQDAQQYTSQQRQGEAAVQSAHSAVVAAARQLAVLKAQRASAEANLAQANAQRDQAKLNLSYTIVTAAQPGRVVQLSGAVGQYVQPGTAVAMFVPDDIWVTANFKETQLDHMRPGDKVALDIDAYPDRAIEGHVASVQPGSGTAFSLLPAENATGNYVKIVQRVPVKIVLDNPPADVALGPGMSVLPSVRVDPSLSLAERLGRVL